MPETQLTPEQMAADVVRMEGDRDKGYSVTFDGALVVHRRAYNAAWDDYAALCWGLAKVIKKDREDRKD